MTREQWIEREAREARARYWGNDNWDRQAEAHKQDWREVVAPFYQKPVADADTLEKLAEIGENAYNADKSNLIDKKWISATKAILRAAKPKVDVDTDDVAFRDALKKSQEIVNNWTPEQRNHNSIGYAGLQANERAELENLRAECKRLRDCEAELLGRREEQAQLFNDAKGYKERWARLKNEVERLQNYNHGLEHENKNLRQDLEALKIPSENIRFAVNAYEVLEECGGDTNVGDLESYMEYLTKHIVFPLIDDMPSRPVKVRFDVTAEKYAQWKLETFGCGNSVADSRQQMDYLAAHAVIDVPAGGRAWRS